MKQFTLIAVTVVATVGSGLAFSGDGNRRFSETLNGLKEAAAVVSTTGTGTFEAVISRDETEIAYELSFKDLEGDVRQAHIHIGLPQNSGGIVLWLCDSDANPSPSVNTPACTANDPSNPRAGRVTGTLTAADVQTLAANGIAGPTPTTAGEFAEVVALIRAGKTYVNIHSVKFAPGEIRSQIDGHDGNDDHGHGGH
jgi:CHRD domain